MGDSFWVAKISNIFWVLEIPEICLGLTVDAGPKPTYEEKMRVPPPWLNSVPILFLQIFLLFRTILLPVFVAVLKLKNLLKLVRILVCGILDYVVVTLPTNYEL